MAGPAVEHRQDLVARFRHQRHVDRIDPHVAKALQPAGVVRRAAEAQRQRLGVAPRLLRHLAKRRDIDLRVAARGVRVPAVAIAHRAPRRPRKGAAEDHRRVRLLHRLRPGHHRVEVDDVAVVLGLRLSPDRLHRLDLLAHLLHPRREDGAVILDLLLVPAAADAEDEAAARHLVDRGDKLRCLDRVALDDEGDAGRDLEPLCRAGRRRQRDEGVHHVVVALAKFLVGPRLARHRDMRMLGRPYGIEAALLERDGKLGRRNRIIGEKDRGAKFHACSPCSMPAAILGSAAKRVDGRFAMSDGLRPRIEQFEAELEDIISPAAPIQHLADGFGGAHGPAEGPLWWKEGGYLLFSDIHNNRRMKHEPGKGAELFLERTNRANGLTRDLQGRLIACEHDSRRVTRQEADGSITVVANSFQGRRLNRPNDVVVKSDGCIYFTDPWTAPTAPEQWDLTFAGVYRVTPDLGTLSLLVDDFVLPNGLAFSPDESVLYINDTRRGHIRAFDMLPNGMLAKQTDR